MRQLGSAGFGVSAPGKTMIVGEYAVLAGHPAVVAAVDLRVRMRRSEDAIQAPFSSALPPEAEAARRFAEAAYGALDNGLMLDVSALRSGEQKLGLGSSAAAAAAAAGLVVAAAGRDLTDPAVRAEVLQFAMKGHQAVAPRGSGADVAASTLGGVLRFVRQGPDKVHTAALPWPQGLISRVVWTGKQVRTSTMLDAVQALRRRDPERLNACIGVLAAEAAGFVDALSAGDVPALLQHTGCYGRAMETLGDAIGAPVVEDSLREIARLAQTFGGAAKPSGAGGGDVALALFADGASVGQFDQACASRGFRVLHLRLGVRGVCVDP